MNPPSQEQTAHVKSHFGFRKTPFTKYMWASHMFLSDGQTELLKGLDLFLEYRGICLVSGQPGVGKSITLRRFRDELDERRYQLFYLFNLRTTPLGFLRSLARALSLSPSYQKADLFDAISTELECFEERTGRHPLLILDDCDGMSDALIEDLRLLTNHVMDSEDRFSVILSGSHSFPARLRQRQNSTLAQRITYSYGLKGLNLTEARKYISFHLERAEGQPDLFHPAAVQLLFHHSRGYPRVINQLASHALIQATIKKRDRVDEKFLRQQVLEQALFENAHNS
jgi:type II secretory pathway predicted ATPase ExeA